MNQSRFAEAVRAIGYPSRPGTGRRKTLHIGGLCAPRRLAYNGAH
ncbi:hypothetical protein D779_3050 [Imhoffiella purpurea]|uniref:Uncharacterized protein n=1 Tax=Imhoffiella purpurea TaxID=1249627 RepID=W9VIA8_9GAMM|nr:hypothetical protein D779_3050 [Imhoffiella purpurea]